MTSPQTISRSWSQIVLAGTHTKNLRVSPFGLAAFLILAPVQVAVIVALLVGWL